MRSLVVAVMLIAVVGCSQGSPQASTSSSPGPSTESIPVVIGSPDTGPSPSASPSPPAESSPTPAPVGSPVASRVLSPATVLPEVSLCTTPVDSFQNGNVGPLFCRDGSINVPAWTVLADVDSNILGLGRDATVDQVKAAIRADFSHANHSTNAIEYSGYQLAAAYYGWQLSFDYWKYVTGS